MSFPENGGDPLSKMYLEETSLLLEGLGNHQNWLLAITCCIDPRDSLSKADSTHDDPDAPHVTQLVVVTCKNLTVVGTTGRSRVHLLFA